MGGSTTNQFIIIPTKLRRNFHPLHTGSTMFAPTVTMDKINPKDCQVASPLVIQGFSNFFRVVSSNLIMSKRTLTYPWSIPQASPKPQMKGIPKHKLLVIRVWGMFQGYVGKFLDYGKPRHTWRIIPASKWLVTLVSKSPKWGDSLYKWPFHGL